jgi:Tol biopolymer transport system component
MNTARWTALAVALPVLTTTLPAQRAIVGGEAPAVAPDGRNIAFLSNRGGGEDLYIIGTDGTHERQVTHGGAGSPSWSPDGRTIRFWGLGADSGKVFTVAPDGTGRRVVATVPGRSPRLSPAGSQVLFLIGPWSATVTAVSKPDGSGARRIAGGGRTTAWNGAWSPDGTRIAYTFGDSTRQLQVHVVGADGTGDRAATDVDRKEGSAQMPAWSPDGKRLAVQVSAAGMSHIWVVDLGTGAARKLAAHAEHWLDEIPAWFPDGNRIAFQSDRSGRREIWVMNADGSGLRQVTGTSR